MKKIVGYEKEKREIDELKRMLLQSKNYRARGVRIPRGLLLCGEPGVGKTMLAKSVATNGIRILNFRASDYFEPEICYALKSVFESAKKKGPTVLLIDELDKIAGTGHMFNMSDNEKTCNTLIAEMDALKDSDEVLVIATCNDRSVLGNAITRPGRFDRIIYVDLPIDSTRKALLKHYFGKIRAPKCFDYDSAVRQTVGFNCAKIECLANECGIIALSKESPVIDENDLRVVINKLEFGAVEGIPLEDKGALRAIAVHEAGHALVASLFCPENFYNASIMPQGESFGHIRYVSSPNMKSKSAIEKDVMIFLAGHVAERVVLSEYRCGSHSDISLASRYIKNAMIKEGMYGYEYAALSENQISEFTMRLCEKKIAEILLRLDKKTETVLRENRDVLEKIINALENKHILSRAELLELKSAA